MEGTLSRFAQVANAVGAVPGKLEKTRILAEFLRDLDDADLYRAAHFFTGTAFARSSGRVVQAGFASVQAASLAISGADAESFHREYLKWSDLGDTVTMLFAGRETSSGISLEALGLRLEQLSDTAAGGAKTLAVTELLRDLSAAEARYVAKILMAELRIGLKEGLVEDAVAKAFGVKPAAVRKAHQLGGDLGKVAVHARHETLESLAVALFVPLKPMLATPETQPKVIAGRMQGNEEPLWVEDKMDGIRAQAHVGISLGEGGEAEGTRVAIYTRDLKEVSAQFPEVVAALRQLPGRLILDGEILAHAGGTPRPFFDLQKRLGRKALTPKVLQQYPVALFAFDLLYQEEPLLDHPFRERRARLEALPSVPALYLSTLRTTPWQRLDEEFDLAKARANEGLMVKHPDSSYTPGKRGMLWIKYKKPLEPLDVVVTGAEWGHGRRREVLSDYTFAVRNEETGELVNIGKAYSGLTDVEIAELTAYFKENTLQSFGRFQLVKPELVLEVAFEAIQQSARHKSGYALRFPRILRIRTDKTVADINSLTDVARMYEQYRLVYDAETVDAPAPEVGEGSEE